MELNDHDYQAWGFRDRFTINEASYLWFGLRPRAIKQVIAVDPLLIPGASANASLLREELKKAVYQSEITAIGIPTVPCIPDEDIPEHLNKNLFRLREIDAQRHGIDSNAFMRDVSESYLQGELQYQKAGQETTGEAIRRLWHGATLHVPPSDKDFRKWKVSKDDLIRFAEKRKQTPRFLFGDTRDELFRLKDHIEKLKAENKTLKATAPGYLDSTMSTMRPSCIPQYCFGRSISAGGRMAGAI